MMKPSRNIEDWQVWMVRMAPEVGCNWHIGCKRRVILSYVNGSCITASLPQGTDVNFHIDPVCFYFQTVPLPKSCTK